MVENALGAGRAATSAAPMKGIGGTLNNLEKTLNKTLGVAGTAPATLPAPATRTAAPSQSVRTATLTVPVAIAPAVHYEDPKLIAPGTAYDELLRRFGPGAMEITTGLNTKTLSYVNREATLQVDVLDGKVSVIQDITHGTSPEELAAGTSGERRSQRRPHRRTSLPRTSLLRQSPPFSSVRLYSIIGQLLPYTRVVA